MNYRSGSVKETEAIARRLIRTFFPGTIVTLKGPFGSGKTTFVRGVLRGLGFRGRVVSPSFLIRKTYQLRRQRSVVGSQQSIKRVHHLDGYRIKHRTELEPLELDAVFGDKNALTFIEWPQPFKPALYGSRLIEVSIALSSKSGRIIRLRVPRRKRRT